MNEYDENAKFASLCLALAASARCETWSDKQIEDEAHRIMDKESTTRK